MRLKSIFSPGFFHLFFSVPFLAGATILLLLLSLQQAFPDTTIAPDNTVLSEALKAGFYPDQDEVPDGNLPQGKVESDFLPTIINITLALISTILLGVLLTAGTFFIIHFGDEEQLKNAKAWMIYAIAGILVVVVAYAAVQGLTRLTFDRPPV